MSEFYIAGIILIFMALVFSLWPWIKHGWKKSRDNRLDHIRQSTNVALYEDHLKDLELAKQQGSINEQQFVQLKNELDRNLLDDSIEETQITRPTNNFSYKPAMLIVVIISVPITALLLYNLLGDSDGWKLKQDLLAQSELEQRLYRAGDSETLQKQLKQKNESLVADLTVYVQRKPENLEAKVLLARNAMAISNYDQAIETYQQILEQQPKAAQIMAELAQAIFVEAENRAVPVVGILAERAIALQADNVMALGLLGVFNFQAQKYELAIQYWQQAISLYPPGSPNARALTNGVNQAQARLASSGKASSSPPKAEGELKVKVAVSLAEGVVVEPNATVFVYARAWQGAKLPLAITRIRAEELPITLELNNSMAMAPGQDLGSVDQVELVARLSPSGNAIAQPGDFQVTLGPVKPAVLTTNVYPLVISQVVSP